MKIENDNGEVVDVHPDLQYEVDKQLENNNHTGISNLLTHNGKSLTVSDLYEKKTGKPWYTAKKEGYTDGSYSQNIKLRQELLSNTTKKESYTEYKSRIQLLNPGLVETKDYNLKGAYEGGLEPKLYEDGIYHLGSRNPKTGELLKSPEHPTWDKLVEGEKKAGYEIYKKNNKYYSKPIKQKGEKEIDKVNTFQEAFKIARDTKGVNQYFVYNNRKFTTNRVGEPFEPSEEVSKELNLNTKDISLQNKMVKSPYTTKEVTKLEKGYKNIESIEARKVEINKMSNADKINAYYKENNIKGKYIIVDKKASRYHVYENGKLLDSYEGIMGENIGDNQTQTHVRNGKVDWSKGNKSTGSGEYTISNVTEKHEHYYNTPSFNLVNSKGIEVPTTFHDTPYFRRKYYNDGDPSNNRASNGCINGKCKDLKELYYKHKIKKGDKVYILPEEAGNTVEIQSDGIKFKSTLENRKLAHDGNISFRVAPSMSKKSVKKYQKELYDAGFLKGNQKKVIDGDWGILSKKADELAKKEGLDVIGRSYGKGLLDSQEEGVDWTSNNLFSKKNVKKSKSQSINVTTNKFWNRSHIKDYQATLYDKGYLKGDKDTQADGIWGEGTQKAYDKAKSEGFDPILDAYEKEIKPIKLFIDKTSFEEDIFNDNPDWKKMGLNNGTDEREFNTITKPYVESLKTNKALVMKKTGISNDVYNQLTKIAFGIYGAESNYGDIKTPGANFLRAVNKSVRKNASSPDVFSKTRTYGASFEGGNSVGLTQIRYSYIAKDPILKKQFDEIGIKSAEDLLDPEKAAIATLLRLAHMYKNELTSTQKNNFTKNLATLAQKWNPNRKRYGERVLKNSKYLSIKQKI